MCVWAVCVAEEVWLWIESCSFGVEHLHLWFSFAQRKKIKRINNRKHAFGRFCQHLSQSLRRFQAIELGIVFHKLLYKSWRQMLSLWLCGKTGKVHSLAKGSSMVSLLWKLDGISWRWGLAPFPGTAPHSVLHAYIQVSVFNEHALKSSLTLLDNRVWEADNMLGPT